MEEKNQERGKEAGMEDQGNRQKSQELLPDPEEEEASMRENREMDCEAGGIETQTP